MRTGNTLDGMYFFLLVIPIVLGFWIGNVLRKKTINHLAMENCQSHNFSTFAGSFVEIIIVITGVLTGLLFVELF